MSRRPRNQAKKSSTSNRPMYDFRGCIRETNEDLCDCLENDCPGCHFPCDFCKSQKCGIECRVNRDFRYDSVGYDGKELVATKKKNGPAAKKDKNNN